MLRGGDLLGFCLACSAEVSSGSVLSALATTPPPKGVGRICRTCIRDQVITKLPTHLIADTVTPPNSISRRLILRGELWAGTGSEGSLRSDCLPKGRDVPGEGSPCRTGNCPKFTHPVSVVSMTSTTCWPCSRLLMRTRPNLLDLVLTRFPTPSLLKQVPPGPGRTARNWPNRVAYPARNHPSPPARW